MSPCTLVIWQTLFKSNVRLSETSMDPTNYITLLQKNDFQIIVKNKKP